MKIYNLFTITCFIFFYSNVFSFDLESYFKISPNFDYDCQKNSVLVNIDFSYFIDEDDFFQFSTYPSGATPALQTIYMLPRFSRFKIRMVNSFNPQDIREFISSNTNSGKFITENISDIVYYKNSFRINYEFKNLETSRYIFQIFLLDEFDNELEINYLERNIYRNYYIRILDNGISSTKELQLDNTNLNLLISGASGTAETFDYEVYLDNTKITSGSKTFSNGDKITDIYVPEGFHVIQCILKSAATGEEKVLTLEVDDAAIGSSDLASLIAPPTCCSTFDPVPGKKYWLSAWVSEEHSQPVMSFSNSEINLVCKDKDANEIKRFVFKPEGTLIEDWQRLSGEFEIPNLTTALTVELKSKANQISYYDDIRIHPFNGSIKSYVYNPETFQLEAELDDNNYATFYEYDQEGKLVRIKKETERGVKTLQESRMNTPK